MKKIDPVESLRQVGGGNPHTEEIAQVWGEAHETMTSPHSVAHDAKYSNGAGFSSEIINERGDTRPFPSEIAAVGGTHVSATEPNDFGTPVIPAPFDGFGGSGSGVDKITGRG